jgi:hypothetical protein
MSKYGKYFKKNLTEDVSTTSSVQSGGVQRDSPGFDKSLDGSNYKSRNKKKTLKLLKMVTDNGCDNPN